jgi:hypothetical protein
MSLAIRIYIELKIYIIRNLLKIYKHSKGQNVLNKLGHRISIMVKTRMMQRDTVE